MLDSYEQQVVKEELKNAYWGWTVAYHPEYEDYVESHEELVHKGFLGIGNIYETVEDLRIRKEDMEWQFYNNLEISLLGIPMGEKPLYIYKNKKNKLLLFR